MTFMEILSRYVATIGAMGGLPPKADTSKVEAFIESRRKKSDDDYLDGENEYSLRKWGNWGGYCPKRFVKKGGTSPSPHDLHQARFGRGPYAGRTGNRFVDDPFFSPFAPGGTFNL
jgi:hypothetical protein